MSARFLCVNMNYIGDALMTTPAIERLHRATGLPVDVIASASALEILRGNPDVGRKIERVASGAVGRCAQLFGEIRRHGYKRVAILASIPVYKTMAVAAGATQVLYVPQLPLGEHLATHISRFSEQFLGLEESPVELSLAVSSEARRRAQSVIADTPGAGPLIAMNIGASRPQKRWPMKHFAECASSLIAGGARVVLLGGMAECADADQIANIVDSCALINQTGRTTIDEMIGLIAESDALITADTAALHIGSALRVPMVALFGSTDPEQTGPLHHSETVVLYDSLACSPCRSRPTCGGRFECMSGITARRVVEAAQTLLESQKPVVAGTSIG